MTVPKIWKSLAIFLIALGPAASVRAQSDLWKTVKPLMESGKHDDALKTLRDQLKSEKDPERKNLLLLALGVVSYRQNRDKEAQEYLGQVSSSARLEDYARFFAGMSYKRSGDLGKAKREFEGVLKSHATPQTQGEATFQLGEIAIIEKNWKEAQSRYKGLQKSMRNTENYPYVLWRMVKIERELKAKGNGCKWARELYSKHPAHPLVAEWGIELSRNKYEGQRLDCNESAKERQTRIRRLQLNGESDRAYQELQSLQGKDRDYSLDAMLANHLISEGHVDEALKVLLNHYKSQGTRPGYLTLLGRAAARAGEFQAAVGAYYKAYQVAPRAGSAKNALFQAAFLSYQFQDYDGSSRKFEEFIKTFPNSGLSKDSQWHMAWIKYLKGDYQGSYDHFHKIATAKPPPRKRGRRGRPVKVEQASTERVRYWMAMSLMKLGKTEEAKQIFLELAKDPSLGYYSVVAYYRLEGMGAAPDKSVIAGVLKASLPKAERAPAANGKGDAAPVPEPEAEAAAPVAANEESESEEALAEGAETAGDGSALAEGEEAGGEELTLDGPASGFQDPYLSRRFERARDLASIGLENFARNELIAIERKSRSATDRRTLMTEYQTVAAYNRSSYIGETFFGATRIRGGLLNARQLWEFTYPRAFEKSVVTSASSFNVPVELVWGIMRAESQYRQDAQSPVGALGLMQVMPFTGRQVAGLIGMNGFQARQLIEPDVNIKIGTRYLARLLEKFQGSVPLVAAGYNAGPHRVYGWLKSFGLLDMDEFIEHVPFVETRNYVKRVVRNYQIYSLLYGGNTSKSLKWLVRPVGVPVTAPVPTKEIW